MITECGHSICLNCLQSQLDYEGFIECKIDKIKIKLKDRSIESFPENQVLLDFLKKHSKASQKERIRSIQTQTSFQRKLAQNVFLIKEPAKSEEVPPSENKEPIGRCSNHQKDLEIFCENCSLWICYQCGLFGDHKGHHFLNLEEFRQNSQNFCTQVSSVHSEILKEEQYLKKHFVEVFQNLKFTNKWESLKKLVKQQVDSIAEQLHKKEHELYVQIDQKFQSCAEHLKEVIEEELEKISKANNAKWKTLENTVKDIQSKEDAQKTYLKVIKQSSGAKFLEEIKKMPQEIEEIQQILKKKLNLFLKQFSFEVTAPPEFHFWIQAPEFKDLNESLQQMNSRDQSTRQIFELKENTRTNNILKDLSIDTSPSFNKKKIHKLNQNQQGEEEEDEGKVRVIDFSSLRNRKKLKTKVEVFKPIKRKNDLDVRAQMYTSQKNIYSPPKQLRTSVGINEERGRQIKLLRLNSDHKRKQGSQELTKRLSTGRDLLTQTNKQFLDLDDKNLNEEDLQGVLQIIKESPNLKALILTNNSFNDRCVE